MTCGIQNHKPVTLKTVLLTITRNANNESYSKVRKAVGVGTLGSVGIDGGAIDGTVIVPLRDFSADAGAA